MFKKVTNVDLMSRLINLENKIDIVNTRVASESFQGCCDCKSRELVVYRELKDYVEDKFTELNNGIKKLCDLKDNNDEAQKFTLDDICEKHKIDIINNLQNIISKMSLDLKNQGKQDNVGNKLMELSEYISTIDSKLGSIYFENELIKHQLKLDEEIRNAIEEVNSLTNIVNCAISEIDKITL